jgi:hypothetical protein
VVPPRVLLVNDTGHLAGIEPDAGARSQSA